MPRNAIRIWRAGARVRRCAVMQASPVTTSVSLLWRVSPTHCYRARAVCAVYRMTRTVDAASDLRQPSTAHAATESVGTTLVSATPIELLLAQFADDINRITGWNPANSDLPVLKQCQSRLQRALDDARRADVWLTPEEVAIQVNRDIALVRRCCRTQREKAGAHKNGALWHIHWPTWEQYWKSSGTPEPVT